MDEKQKAGRDERFNRNGASDLRDNEAQNLKYNEKENSFELDVESLDEDYQHSDPYDTAAVSGDDINSDYDEANPYVGAEYEKDASLEKDVDKLGMHIAGEESFKVSDKNKKLSNTAEDERADLDAEGYPKFKK